MTNDHLEHNIYDPLCLCDDCNEKFKQQSRRMWNLIGEALKSGGKEK